MSTQVKIRILLISTALSIALILGLAITHVVTSYVPTTKTANTQAWKITNQEYGNKISMLSANNGWIIMFIGKNAYLYHWNGTSWANAGTVTHTQNIVRGDIFMVSTTDGWIVLGGPLGGSSNLAQSIIYRWNGSTWTQFATVTDPNAVSLSALDMVSATDGWATADFNFGSHYYRWNGSAWQKSTSIWLPNDAGNDIDMVSSIDGWAVGFHGDIYRWNGSSWNEVASPVTTSLNSLAMISATDGWTVGDNGVILRWSGSTWAQVSSPVTTTLNSVSMVSATDGWVVGGGWNGNSDDPGVILHWNGSSWDQAASPTTAELNDIAMISSYDGWITGYGATLHYEPSTLTANYTSGKPGSFFNITGTEFPPYSPVSITINSHPLTSTVSTDVSGVFTFTLSTSQADPGTYYVTASVNPKATTSFILAMDHPARPQDGAWPVIEVPIGIAYKTVYLPLIKK